MNVRKLQKLKLIQIYVKDVDYVKNLVLLKQSKEKKEMLPHHFLCIIKRSTGSSRLADDDQFIIEWSQTPDGKPAAIPLGSIVGETSPLHTHCNA